tara:strand:+ start:145 stop:474 length:330 start_codon:yes stop_codon:yes gene_type:complete
MAADNEYGMVIDLTTEKIQKAPRGKEKTYDEGLVAYLKANVTKTKAVGLTSFVNLRTSFPPTDEGDLSYQNEKQRLAAHIRSHARAAGLVKIGIDWHPEGGYPQVSLKG